MVITNVTGNITTPPLTLNKVLAPLIGALCVFATLTIWLDAAYAERCFEAAILMVAAVVVVVRGPPRPRFIPLALAMVALWGPLQLIAGWSVYRYETWTAALRWATLTATFFLAYEVLENRQTRERSRTLLAIFGAAMALFAVVQAYTSQGSYFWLFGSGQPEIFGPFQNPNNYAAFIELILPLTLWEGLKRPRYRTVWFTMAGAMAASVVASGSRAGSALVAAEIPAVFAVAYLSRQFPRRQVVAALVKMAVVAVLCLAASGWETLRLRLTVMDPLLYRREMLYSAIAMVKTRPWTGFGLGTFSTVYPAYAVFDNGYYVNHAHNDWAEWAAEGGLPFLLLLGAIAIASSLTAIRSGWGLGLVVVYGHALVDFPMQRTGLATWVFVVGAMLAAEFESKRRQREPSGNQVRPRRAAIAENQLDERTAGASFEA
jgi:O-antigen ligase